jgi:hypothetical protein
MQCILSHRLPDEILCIAVRDPSYTIILLGLFADFAPFPRFLGLEALF